jgi:hypothetical protein
VRIQRQHLVLELAFEAAGHAEHHDQRRDTQHDAHRRDRREDRKDAQQERHHRQQPAGEDPDDAGGLEDARLMVGESEGHEADDHQPQPCHEPDGRPAGSPPAVQVTEPDQSLEAQLQQLREHPAEADRDGDRQQCPARSVGQLRPGREPRRSHERRDRQRREHPQQDLDDGEPGGQVHDVGGTR